MRAALPNAFLFSLTGTPINKADKNTFWAFGAKEDEGGYLSRYTYQDSLRDGATLPLHFESRLVDIHIDKESIDRLFAEFQEASALDDLQADALSGKSARTNAFLRARAEQGLIVSIEFVKELCKIAAETVQAEKDLVEEVQEKTPKAALTELKTEQTPAVVARVVTDIDEIVIVLFPSWQTSTQGKQEVHKALRKALLKYRLHTDQVLFERTYGYINEYY